MVEEQEVVVLLASVVLVLLGWDPRLYPWLFSKDIFRYRFDSCNIRHCQVLANRFPRKVKSRRQ
jgi:hypothetical protein